MKTKSVQYSVTSHQAATLSEKRTVSSINNTLFMLDNLVRKINLRHSLAVAQAERWKVRVLLLLSLPPPPPTLHMEDYPFSASFIFESFIFNPFNSGYR